jgi:hypothetical protein
MRRKKRRIRLDEKIRHRRGSQRNAQRGSVPEGHRASEGQEPTTRRAMPGHGSITGKTVKYDTFRYFGLIKDPEDVRMGVSVMDDQGEISASSYLDVTAKRLLLRTLTRRPGAEVIETGLTNTADSGGGTCKSVDLAKCIIERGFGGQSWRLIRVKSNSGDDVGVALRRLDSPDRARYVTAHLDDAADTDLRRLGQCSVGKQLVALLIVGDIHVTVGIGHRKG